MARPVAALVLAAGRSSRAGDTNKLLAKLEGRSLVGTVCRAALASNADPVVVVTGHEAGTVEADLSGLSVTCVHNPHHNDGLSTSLRAGVKALPQGVAGAIVLLADMPQVTAAHIDRLIAAFDGGDEVNLVYATANGQRGNPVLWSSRLFDELAVVTGDTGGRDLLRRHLDRAVAVEIGPAALADLDTADQLAAAGAELR